MKKSKPEEMALELKRLRDRAVSVTRLRRTKRARARRAFAARLESELKRIDIETKSQLDAIATAAKGLLGRSAKGAGRRDWLAGEWLEFFRAKERERIEAERIASAQWHSIRRAKWRNNGEVIVANHRQIENGEWWIYFTISNRSPMNDMHCCCTLADFIKQSEGWHRITRGRRKS